ncbi:MAG: J domain-containing protein [Candidatus Omnitrophica bacterium]|nr:J domain-containing protein [Candidatus Omnitrophota bacterium]
MADFKQIDAARKILGLGEFATMEHITGVYRKLALKYHPDKCKKKNKKACEERFKQISSAKDILFSYCAGYKYSFKEKDVKRNLMSEEEYEHLKRFFDGWLGNLDL